MLPAMSYADSTMSEIEFLRSLDAQLKTVEEQQQKVSSELMQLRTLSLMQAEQSAMLERLFNDELRISKAERDTFEAVVDSQGKQIASLKAENLWLKVGLIVVGVGSVVYIVYDIVNNQITVASIYSVMDSILAP
jgi:hypothetical protein